MLPHPNNDPLNYNLAAANIRARANPSAAKLDLIGFRIECMRYSRIRAIMAEMGQSDTALLIALAKHGVKFNSVKEDPELFFSISSEQKDSFAQHGILNPTWFQLIGTSECLSLSRDECERAFRELKEGE